MYKLLELTGEQDAHSLSIILEALADSQKDDERSPRDLFQQMVYYNYPLVVQLSLTHIPVTIFGFVIGKPKLNLILNTKMKLNLVLI